MRKECIEVIMKFAGIRQGKIAGWCEDRINGSEQFLRKVRNDNPEFAKEVAFDLECNLVSYIDLTGLPSRSLEQAQRFLYGIWL